MAEEKKTTTKTTAKASGTKTSASKTAGTKTTAAKTTAKASGTKATAAKTTASKTAGAKTTAAKSGAKTTAAKSTTAKRTSTSKTTVSRSSKPKATPVAEQEEVTVAIPVEDMAVPVEETPVVETVAQNVETVASAPVVEETVEIAPVVEEAPSAPESVEEPSAPAEAQEQAVPTEEPQAPAQEKGKAGKIIGRIFAILGYGILAFLVVAAGWLAIDKLVMKSTIPQAYGVSALNVKTDSMNGTQKGSFAGGDVIFIWRHPDADNLKKGDIITFWEIDKNGKPMKDKLPTTHRIVDVNEDGTYVTKGDNPQNSVDINPVKPENVVGVVLFHIPKAGHFINWISTGGGALYLVAFGALIVGLIYVAKKKDWN